MPERRLYFDTRKPQSAFVFWQKHRKDQANVHSIVLMNITSKLVDTSDIPLFTPITTSALSVNIIYLRRTFVKQFRL